MVNKTSKVEFDDNVLRVTIIDDISDEIAQKLIQEAQELSRSAQRNNVKVPLLVDVTTTSVGNIVKRLTKTLIDEINPERVVLLGTSGDKASFFKDTTNQRVKVKAFASSKKARRWLGRKRLFGSLSPRGLLIAGAGVTILALAWQQLIAPLLLQLPSNFSYQATVISYDNFYDDRIAGYEGKTLSDTRFGYQAIARRDGVLDIKNKFEVSTTSGQKIFAVERVYGIDQKTWQHVPERGDRTRAGYLFAPTNLVKEDFIYWHVNYDSPALMKFQEEEEVLGLTTYRYAADFRADQTKELADLPGVGETRGINTDVNLHLWIEPRSGHLVKYEDRATAYFYELATGKRLNPWNQFNNTYNFNSVAAQVRLARQAMQHQELIEIITPLTLVAVAMVLIMWSIILSRRRKKEDITAKAWALTGAATIAIVTLAVGVGWVTNNVLLTRLHPSFPAMHPLTAMNLLIFASVLYVIAQFRMSRKVKLVICALLSLVIISAVFYFIHLIFGLQLGVDTLLKMLRLPPSTGVSPNTAICFLLIAIAILLSLYFKNRIASYVTQGIFLVALGLGVFAVGGYAFSLQTLVTITWFKTMALHTALLTIALVVSIFLLHPDWNITKRVQSASRHIWLSLVVLLVLLAATGFSWQSAIANSVRRTELRFQTDTNSLETTVITELTKYVNALYGVRGLLAASNEVSREEWKAYVDDLHLQQNYPGMSGLGFAQLVAPSQKAAHIAEIRSQGFPTYNIHPEGTRELYSSILYIEPFNERNQRAFGYDMLSESVRRQAMEYARDTGEATLSGKVTLVQETTVDRQAGMLIYLPVYRHGASLTSLENRRAALVGYVYTPIRISSFMRPILNNQAGGIDVDLFDTPDANRAGASNRLFATDTSGRTANFTRTETTTVANHGLTFRFSTLPAYDTDASESLPGIVLHGGLTLSVLLALLTFLLSSSRSRALKLAQLMTNDLREERNLAITNERKLQAILKSIGDGVFVIDPKGTIILFNKAAELISGFSGIEAVGQHYKTIFDFRSEKTGRPVNDFIAVALGGKAAQMASYTLLKRKDGKSIPVADSAAAVMSTSGDIDGAVIVFRDISRERELEKTKDEFLSIASHELRTPMGAVRANTAMMLDGDFGPVNKGLVDPLRDVHASSVRLVELINDLLSAARIEAGRMKFTLNEFDPADILKSTVRDLAPLASEKGLRLSFEGETAPIQADLNKLRQVLTNLIGNALKFTKDGAITVSGRLRDDMLEVAVTDTGIGIALAEQKRLFGKFSQIGSEESGKPVGTGLGLYISRQMMRKMGGELWLQASRPDKGSTFKLSVPRAHTSSARKVKRAITQEAEEHTDQK
ncbi:MAG TPA: porin PorA family protein [Candidatus Saccharimonadales bacterium]